MPWEPLAWLDDELAEWRARSLWRTPTIRGGTQGPHIVMDGERLVNFGANDYLALAGDHRITSAVATSLKMAGWGSGASPLVTGRTAAQAELERNLAAWEGAESAIVCGSGFAANAGTVACLVGSEDVIFSDAKNHASLIDGCRLSRASVMIYPHRDLSTLRAQLASSQTARRRLIVTDGVFSMDGDLAPLPDLVELAEQYQAMLLVDEAHATGVLGDEGRGTCEHWGVERYVSIRVGTLSKALGSIGGFVVGPRRLIDWIFQRSRPYVFSTALPAACCVASLAALRIVQQEPFRRHQLAERVMHLRENLRHDGWIVDTSPTPIIPLRIGDSNKTMALAKSLREQGCWVPGIRPPTVPTDEGLLRISLSYGHSADDLQRLQAALRAAKLSA